MKKRINLSVLAKQIAGCEHLKQQVSIAQIKEIIKCMLLQLKQYDTETIINTVELYKKKTSN